ncbi:MAG: alpha-amylase [Gammaproteobacteria bacterium]|nr:alpha-amylase [Gammaproteobacteria bacterium]
MKLYNLFPLLAGEFKNWESHIDRAAAMGFDWIFVNPVQRTGASGSLYSIADYFQLNPAFVSKRSLRTPNSQLKAINSIASSHYGVRMMTDLVINHCAIDSKLTRQHPEWFVHDQHGKIKHPSCVEDDGTEVVWYDLAQFDHVNSKDSEGLYRYMVRIVEHYISLGFSGFRCDAAYQIPHQLWNRLIGNIKRRFPDVMFIAETLGCSEQQCRQTAQAGFDYIFNSSKWWDFSSPWLIDQYHQYRDAVVPSISFPESHDTQRLFHDSDQNVEVLKQRYLFSAVFSAGVMMPMGYEFGFKKPLHVVNTTPDDWETTDIDLTDFITQVNHFKSKYKVFQEDGPINIISDDNTPVLFMWKASNCQEQEALILLNKDPWNKHHFFSDDLYHHVQSDKQLQDLSIEYPLDFLPTPYEFGLNPGMARVMVAA